MAVAKRSLSGWTVEYLLTEKMGIIVGIVLVFVVAFITVDGSPRPTALGLPIWFLWMLLAVFIEYALVYRLSTHYMAERIGSVGLGGE